MREKMINYFIPETREPKEAARSLCVLLSATISFCIHTVCVFYFFLLGYTALGVINIGSVLVYLVSILIIHFGYERFTPTIIVMEVLCYSVVTTTLCGPYADTHWYMLPCMTLTILLNKLPKNGKAGIIAVLCLGLLYCQFVGYFVTPVIDIEKNFFIRAFTTFVIMGTSIMLFMFDYLIQKIEEALLAQKEARLTEQIYTDPLTELANRRYAELFFSTMEAARTAADGGVCFAMCDIDDFKRINDAHGHDVGDRVLMAYAKAFKASLRHTDQVFRWGGEEFLMVLLDISLDQAAATLGALCEKIKGIVVETEDGPVSATITIGVSQLLDGDIEGAILACDKKLYEGKNSGKNMVKW